MVVEVVVGAPVVVVVVVVCSFGLTIVLATELSVSLKPSAFTSVSATVMVYQALVTPVKICLSSKVY